MNFVIENSYLIPLLPLIGAVVAGFFGARYLKGASHLPIWIGVGIAALMSLGLLFGMLGSVEEGQPFFEVRDWFTWIKTGDTDQSFVATAGALFDPLSAVMLSVVCGIGFLITVFAAGYMKGEEGYFRFFAYLGLFIFAMTCLVMGNNLVMLYLGWEGVGLCSYLLIGYYYDKPAAREAAKKAFLVNRIGDLGFGLGIMLTFLVFGTVSYFGSEANPAGFLAMAGDPEALARIPAWKQDLIPFIPFLLMVGAFGKSAQFPLYVWLPDAMEGPTPVSALIHAATMVTAGVYMIARCSTVFVQVPAAMATVAAVGLFTAVFAATIALRQFDLKKVFAYSTVSQLGFMFVAVGLLAPVAGVFHLVTHAFFKALLFLSSGVVMHAMAGELDLRKMSGLKRTLPKTRILMLIGCLALAGFPLTSGFWSKDEIVAAAYGKHTGAGTIAFVILLVTAFLTAYYTFRLYFRVFEGPEVIPAPPVDAHGQFAGHDSHADDHARKTGGAASSSALQTGTAHESGVDKHLATDTAHHGSAHHGSAAHGGHGHGGHGHGHGDHHHDHEPMIMILPLIILAIGALLAGFLNTPMNHTLGDFLGHSPSFHRGYDLANGVYPAHHVDEHQWGRHSDESAWHLVPMFASIAVSLGGIGLAYLLHLKDRRRADDLAAMVPGVARAIENKYWVDEAYQSMIVEPLRALGRFFFAVDRYIVDGLVWLISFVPQAGGWALKLGVQRGYLQGYAAVMLFGLAAILLVIFL